MKDPAGITDQNRSPPTATLQTGKSNLMVLFLEGPISASYTLFASFPKKGLFLAICPISVNTHRLANGISFAWLKIELRKTTELAGAFFVYFSSVTC